MSFHDILFEIAQRKCCKRLPNKEILQDITGIMGPGLNTIMGPTGSGKNYYFLCCCNLLDVYLHLYMCLQEVIAFIIKIHASRGIFEMHANQFWWAWPLRFWRFCSFSVLAEIPFWIMDYNPWGSNNRICSNDSCK